MERLGVYLTVYSNMVDGDTSEFKRKISVIRRQRIN